MLPDCLELKPGYYCVIPYTLGTQSLISSHEALSFIPISDSLLAASNATLLSQGLTLCFSQYLLHAFALWRESPPLPFLQIVLGAEGSGLFSPLPGSLY